MSDLSEHRDKSYCHDAIGIAVEYERKILECKDRIRQLEHQLTQRDIEIKNLRYLLER